MSAVLRRLAGFARFWYGFVVGDDWTLAVAVIVSLAVTALLQRHGLGVWWLVPLVVVSAVGVSLVRAHVAKPGS